MRKMGGEQNQIERDRLIDSCNYSTHVSIAFHDFDVAMPDQ